MNILFLYKEEWEKDYVSQKLSGHTITFSKSLDEVNKETLGATEVLSIFVYHKCGESEISKMPNLKLIATRSTGFDHIDLEFAKARGVEVCFVPSYGENTVAEFTFALILSLSRKIPEAHNQVTSTGSFTQGNLRGFDLAGKTIGVVGTGRIGSHVIKIAKGFGMEVIAYDPYPKQGLDLELGFRYAQFEELLSLSDVITLHAMLDDSTYHMINDLSIQHIKHGAVLINTARGGLVQTSSLAKALEGGVVSAAGLDVLEEENLMGEELKLLSDPGKHTEEINNILVNNYLVNHPRVIVTPHIAFNTEEAIRRILDTTIDNICSFALSNEVKNKVAI
ncbi:MAG: NAD(P)-dependent oxidoreductase [Patescibacteria group bacterium]